jgi:hypothetical protein
MEGQFVQDLKDICISRSRRSSSWGSSAALPHISN